MSATRSRANPGGARVLDMGEVLPFRQRKPEWFKRPAPGSARYRPYVTASTTGSVPLVLRLPEPPGRVAAARGA